MSLLVLFQKSFAQSGQEAAALEEQVSQPLAEVAISFSQPIAARPADLRSSRDTGGSGREGVDLRREANDSRNDL